MGFFEDVKNEVDRKQQIEELDKELLLLFNRRQKIYGQLERSINYAEELKLKQKNVIEQAQSFLKAEKFDVEVNATFNSPGLTAKLGAYVFDLLFKNLREFHIEIPRKWNDDLYLADVRSVNNNFNGHLSQDKLQVVILDNRSLNELDRKKKALSDLDKDIYLAEEKIKNNYVPDLQIYSDKFSEYFNDFQEYLNHLDKKISL